MCLSPALSFVGSSLFDCLLIFLVFFLDSANFTFVARDPNTGKAADVPPLVLGTDEEKQVFDKCELIRQAR